MDNYLAHKLARAVYYMLTRDTVFDLQHSSTGKGAERMSRTPHWTSTGSAWHVVR